MSHLTSSTHRLPRHARCVLSRLRCNGHILLLGSYLSRIGRIENPSCSACGYSSQDTSHLILHCPATDSLRSLGSCPASGAPWSSAKLPSQGRGRVTTTTDETPVGVKRALRIYQRTKQLANTAVAVFLDTVILFNLNFQQKTNDGKELLVNVRCISSSLFMHHVISSYCICDQRSFCYKPMHRHFTGSFMAVIGILRH